AGDSDVAVIDYIVARYGEYVLLKPRLGAHTIVLWLSPFVLLFIGIASLIIWQRRRPQMAGEALSTEEESALEDILKDR
ncbi:MAG: cytochrome c-type biogenesis protein, partial [Hyphomicrobiales bacterium]